MDYELKGYQMTSGQGEAVARRYHKHLSKDGKVTYLVPDGQDNAGDNIYCSNPDNAPGNGFGGALLHMALVGGGEFILNGGWHTNSDDLFKATGVDIRNKHWSFTVIGKEIEWNYWKSDVIKDVLYIDPPGGVIDFVPYGDHPKAKELANQLQDKVYCHVETNGGSHSSYIFPDGKTWKDFKDENN